MKPIPVLFTLLLVSCQNDSGSHTSLAGSWEGTSELEGSTLTVGTVSGSVWGEPGRLVEEVAIGAEVRGENDLFGDVYGMDVAGDRIYVLDPVLFTVRVFDLAGNHLMDIGRDGEGPGEFSRLADLGVDPVRNHLVVRETSGVLHRFTLDGEFLHRTLHRFQMSEGGRGFLMRVTRDGEAILPQYYFERVPGGTPPLVRRYFLYTFDPSGMPVDSMEIPFESDQPHVMRAYTPDGGAYRPEPVPFVPGEVWTVGWDGSYIRGVPDQYRFEIRYRDGRRTVITRAADPVPVRPEEERAHRRRVSELLRDVDPGWSWDGPEIPETKPWYNAIIPDRSGRIWVLREGEGRPTEDWTEPDDWRGWRDEPEWVSEYWFDVFEEASGRYLGPVDAPDGLLPEPEPVIEGSLFIGLTTDDLGRPILRRYRLVFPEREALG